MAESKDYLDSFVQLPELNTREERTALWRRSMATLANAAVGQRPVPLEGIHPGRILTGVRTAFASNLIDDLDWLSPPAAARALYELASATPQGSEKRELGRRVLTRLYAGDAETFIALACAFAMDSRKTLTRPPVRARVALAMGLPLGLATQADRLALSLVSQPELRHQWLAQPAVGSLPSRRFAARLLERAARAATLRAAQGDMGHLRVFRDPVVMEAWRRLLADRESLVWRHVAVARGLLSRALPELSDVIQRHLAPALTPTEWRRAATSLATQVSFDRDQAARQCVEVLRGPLVKRDPGLAGSVVFGLARAADAEPELAEELLDQAVRHGSLEAAESLVELRRERLGRGLGAWASRYCAGQLREEATKARGDDGHLALCEALIRDLTPRDERAANLRDHLDDALAAFAGRGAEPASSAAREVFDRVVHMLADLERTYRIEPNARLRAFGLLRELDLTLLETSTLTHLMMLGARTGQTSASAAPLDGAARLDGVYDRLTDLLLELERAPIQDGQPLRHPLLRMRRLRSLLHLIDAEGDLGDETEGQRERRLRSAKILFERVRDDAPSRLRRVMCATLARACDALVRDNVCKLSDVFVAATDHVTSREDLATLAEASMMPDFENVVGAYAELLGGLEQPHPGGAATGSHTRGILDALRRVGEELPWANSSRVTALRLALLRLVSELERVATARRLDDLAAGPDVTILGHLETTLHTLALLTAGARRRLMDDARREVPASAGAMRMLDLAAETVRQDGKADVAGAVAALSGVLREELPPAIAESAIRIVARVAALPAAGPGLAPASVIPPPRQTLPIPAWLPASRTIGGFHVRRCLGAGSGGSVFVVARAEERHEPHATELALKVPEYDASVALTLSEDEFLRMFREEAGALLAVPNHTNLAGFVTFDAGAKPKPILVMELVEGPTLERVIELGALAMDEALAVLDGVAAGLEAMHRAGVGHLDVKPSNVILRSAGNAGPQPPAPVLVDFGLAGRQLRPGCATANYGAPEIWGLVPEGRTPTPMSADAYALACLAFELLTGVTLFGGSTHLEIIRSHLAHDGFPPALAQLRAQAGLFGLSDLLASMLRRDPASRLPVAEFRERLGSLAPRLSSTPWPLPADLQASTS
ncbi:MAG: serine/threonine protein kinase [Proteobacteria bacterium]|nr:serine/threonine protein kinase [Pseudomonadota bacterium]